MPSTVPRHRFGTIALALVLNGIGGCSSQRPALPETPPVGEVVLNVGGVVVSVSDAVPADWQQRLEEVYGTSRLHTAVWDALMRVAKLDRHSPRVLEVQVTRFRLRSSALVLWVGLMAGVDYLDVKAVVRDGTRTVREYTTGAATAGLGWGLIGQVERFQKLAGAVAERVAEQL